MEKTQVYNLVILDKSGSMVSIRKATIDSINETINSIRQMQLKHADTQDHFLTLHTFCGCTQEDIYYNTPIAEVENIKPQDYQPCCSTPLYDAIGMSINRLSKHVEGKEYVAAVVTIITDGYENASKEYTRDMVAQLIAQQREQGWAIAYIGANHDVEATAMSLNINNTMRFESNDESVTESFCRHSRMVDDYCGAIPMPCERTNKDFKEALRQLSDDIYKIRKNREEREKSRE